MGNSTAPPQKCFISHSCPKHKKFSSTVFKIFRLALSKFCAYGGAGWNVIFHFKFSG
nr:MAG TPA: hypothetical protein [Bacteriophage sp.]